jgi:hypothetical protein
MMRLRRGKFAAMAGVPSGNSETMAPWEIPKKLARLSYYVQNLKQFQRYGSGLRAMIVTMTAAPCSIGT